MSTDSAMSYGFVNIKVQHVKDFPPVYEQVRYDQFVRRLFKVDTFKEMAHHAKGGCCEEAGELSDAIKRHITYGKPLTAVDKDGQTIYAKIIEELGDLRFYMQAVQQIFSISEQAILDHNAAKLSERYVKLAYSDEAAQARADKENGAAT